MPHPASKPCAAERPLFSPRPLHERAVCEAARRRMVSHYLGHCLVALLCSQKAASLRHAVQTHAGPEDARKYLHPQANLLLKRGGHRTRDGDGSRGAEIPKRAGQRCGAGHRGARCCEARHCHAHRCAEGRSVGRRCGGRCHEVGRCAWHPHEVHRREAGRCVKHRCGAEHCEAGRGAGREVAVIPRWNCRTAKMAERFWCGPPCASERRRPWKGGERASWAVRP